MLTYDEELNGLTEHIIKYLINQLRDSIPLSGSFNRVFMQFITNYTKEHTGLLSIEPTASDKRRKVVAGVIKEGTDRLYSHIMATGTNDELISYLSGDGTKGELIDSYKKLFASADDD